MLIELKHVESEEISPDKYIHLTDVERSNIKSTRIVPPSLGEEGFGKIEVIYENPIYKINYE